MSEKLTREHESLDLVKQVLLRQALQLHLRDEQVEEDLRVRLLLACSEHSDAVSDHLRTFTLFFLTSSQHGIAKSSHALRS